MRILALLIFFLFLFPDSVFAALSLSLEGIPGEIDSDREFTGNVSLTCSNCGDSYLRGAFFSPGATDYFGYTQNDAGDWVNASNPKTIYFHLPPVESSWSGQLKFKFDQEKATGNYQFKVMRYTSSGSKSGETNLFSVNVITPVTPTTTASPTLSPISSPTSSPSPSPTATKTVTQTPTKAPTQFQTSVNPSTKTVASTPSTPSTTPSPTNKEIVGIDILSSSDSASPSSEVTSPPPLIAGKGDSRQISPLTLFGIIATTTALLSLVFWRLRKLTRPNRVK